MLKTINLFLSFLVPVMLAGQNIIHLKQIFRHQDYGIIDRLRITQVLPPDIPGRQEVIDIDFSVPNHVVYEKDGARFVHFDINEPDFKCPPVITYKLLVYPYDYKIAGERRAVAALDGEDLSPFLNKEAYINPGNKKMVEAAKTIPGTTEEETVRNIFQFVLNHMEYRRFNQQDRGAVKALKQGKGDCTEYSELMVSMCRAKGIPARLVAGAAAISDNINGNILHNWVEVHFKDRGWVPFDPTFADGPFDECPTSFDHLPATYVYFSFDRSGMGSGYRYNSSSRGSMNMNYDFQLEMISQKALNRARMLLQSGEPDSALYCLEGVFPEGVDHFETNLLQMEAHCARNDLEKALRHLQKAGRLAKTAEEKAGYLLASALWHAVQGDTANALNQLEKYMAIENGRTGKLLRMLENGAFSSLLPNPRFLKLLKTSNLEYMNLCNALLFPGGVTLTDFRLAMPYLHFPVWQDYKYYDHELDYFQSQAKKLGIRRVEVEGEKSARLYEFDQLGNLQVYQDYLSRKEILYNAAGRKTVIKYFLNEEHTMVLAYTWHYLYDSDGTLIEIRGCAGHCTAETAKPLLRFEQQSGSGIIVLRFDEQGQPLAKIMATHDNARITALTFLLAGDTARVYWNFDPAENKITRQWQMQDTAIVLEFFSLDAQNRIYEGDILFPHHQKFIYEYDATGRIDKFFSLVVTTNKTPSILYSKIFRYDKKGILNKTVQYTGDYIERPNGNPRFNIKYRRVIRFLYSHSYN